MRTLVCWLLLCISGWANLPLTCHVPKREAALRKGGAVLLNAELTNSSGRLIDGRLVATVLRAGVRVSTHAGPELVVVPGKTRAQLLLPPPLDADYGEGYAARLDFTGKDGSVSFGDIPLGAFPLGGEEFMIAIARTERRTSEADRIRERSVRLETLRPALDATSWFATASITVATPDLPTQAAAWTAFDVAVIDGPSFAEMTARQLDALARWICAGGSAIIFPEEEVRERHLAFLHGLSSQAAKLQLDAQGRFAAAGNVRIAAGLGRLLIAGSPPNTRPEADANGWRLEIAWLWKVRPELFPNIARDGKWPARQGDREFWQNVSGPDLEHWVRAFAIEADRAATERPRPLPAGWVALLLVGLLILAGPADWYLLGWIRRRRWTWVLFPSICVVFAWIASVLASRHLGPQSRSVTVRMIDVGEEGRPLRELVYRMRIPTRDEEWVTESADGLAAAMQPREILDDGGHFAPAGELPETRAEWSSASRLMLRQNLRQWTPNWQQAVSIGPRSTEDPGWAELITRWKRHFSGSDENLAAMRGDYWVFYHSGAQMVADAGQVLPGHSPLSPDVAARLCVVEPPLPDILEGRSPVVTSKEMLQPTARDRLVILAWRKTSEGLEVLRRHVSTRELEGMP